jgi:hypothetical protein
MCSGPQWWLYDWQTLIAGLIAGVLALIAAGATIWGTVKSANRQIKAAQEQVKAARDQTAVLRDIEDHRLASEAFAFHSMLEAAMGRVIEDARAAEVMKWRGGTTVAHLTEAYEARRRIKRTGFVELRSGLLRFGGALTTPLLRLDGEIENFAAQVRTQRGNAANAFWEQNFGEVEGLAQSLTSIKQQADALRDEAQTGMERCRARPRSGSERCARE